MNKLWSVGEIGENNIKEKKVLRIFLIVVLIGWIPPLLLSLIEGVFLTHNDKLGFASSYAFHIQYFIVIPLFIFSEFYSFKIINHKIEFIKKSNLIPDKNDPELNSVLLNAIKLANSQWIHILMIALIIGYRFYLQHEYTFICKTWYAYSCNGHNINWTYAGLWKSWVSNTLFAYTFIRNVWIILVYTYLIRKISQLPLQLSAMHPDKFGGLGFLCELPFPFTFSTVAFSILVSCSISLRIVYQHKDLEEFYPIIIALALMIIIIHAFPLVSLIGPLLRSKLSQRKEYSALVLLHHHDFHSKWIVGINKDEPILGSPDPSSAADSNTYFEAIRKMKIIPVDIRSLLTVSIVSLLPVISIFFIKYPVKEIIQYLFKMLFSSGVV